MRKEFDMMKNGMLTLAGGLGGAFLASVGQVAAAESNVPAPPNVIVFMTDDQGAGDARALGHPYLKTPNLDRLIEEGTTFTQFYATGAVCSPSRASFMTGKFPADMGIHHIFITLKQAAERDTAACMPDIPTIPDMMKAAGYRTAHYGKWHMTSGGNYSPPTPAELGIDDIKLVGGGATAAPVWDSSDPYFRAKSSGLFVDAAIDFIERGKGRPFFVNVWTLVPHAPLKPMPEEMAVYEELKTSPDDFESWMKEYVSNAKNPDSQMATYCAAMTGMDAALGRLLDYLDRNNLAENTIILFTSDNGPEDYRAGNSRNAGMGSPGIYRARKRSLYEGGVRVPFVVRWPGVVPAGRVDSDSVLSAVDILPTLAAIAGTPADIIFTAGNRGENVISAFKGQAFTRSKPLFWEWQHAVLGNPAYAPPVMAVRDGDWKLFCNLDGSKVELYNISDDQEERNNVAAQHPEVTQKLKAKLLDWHQSWPETPAPPM
jgi:arylsulfatase A-like enzyme